MVLAVFFVFFFFFYNLHWYINRNLSNFIFQLFKPNAMLSLLIQRLLPTTSDRFLTSRAVTLLSCFQFLLQWVWGIEASRDKELMNNDVIMLEPRKVPLIKFTCLSSLSQSFLFSFSRGFLFQSFC